MEKRTDSRDRGRKAEGAPKCDADGAHLTENLQTFFDTVKDFLFVLDMNGRIRHVNRTVTDRLGHTEDDLRGVSVLEVHPPDRRDEAGRIVQAMLRNDVEYCPVPLMTATGALIPVETRVSAGRWDGEPALFGVSKDITDLKRSEEKFSRAFHNSAALMAISTVDEGRFIDVNQAFLDTTGYPREEVIGATSSELNLFVNPDDRENVRRIYETAGKARDVEVLVRTCDGKMRDGLFSVDQIAVGEETCWLTVMSDVTERKRYESELQRLSQIQQHLMRLATDFVNVPVVRQDKAVDQALATMGGG